MTINEKTGNGIFCICSVELLLLYCLYYSTARQFCSTHDEANFTIFSSHKSQSKPQDLIMEKFAPNIG